MDPDTTPELGMAGKSSDTDLANCTKLSGPSAPSTAHSCNNSEHGTVPPCSGPTRDNANFEFLLLARWITHSHVQQLTLSLEASLTLISRGDGLAQGV